jgi:hypothetical protein
VSAFLHSIPALIVSLSRSLKVAIEKYIELIDNQTMGEKIENCVIVLYIPPLFFFLPFLPTC